jgi:hypothetical protein
LRQRRGNEYLFPCRMRRGLFLLAD